jgi:DNA-directed RNA polymerase subunit omega
MARITIQDCLRVVPNRFELAILAAHRAHAIMSGSKLLTDRDDKEVVLALREIAEEKVDVEVLKNLVIAKYRKGAVVENQPAKNISFFTANDFSSAIFGEDADASMVSGDIDFDIASDSIFSDQNVETDD